MDSFTISDLIAATPLEIYRAWLDERLHAAFTGSPATSNPTVGGAFTAWDGYIQGTHLALDEGRRIRQAWRTTEFPDGSESSVVEIGLVPAPDGTILTLHHDLIPEGQAESYLSGWREYYLEPLKRHFGAKPKAAAKKAAPKRKANAKPRRAAPKRKVKAQASERKASPKPKAKKKRKTRR